MRGIVKELKIVDFIDPVFDNKELPTNYKKLINRMEQFLIANKDQSYCIPSFIDSEENVAIAVIRTRKKKKDSFITLINPTILKYKGLIASEEKMYTREGVYLVQRSPKILYAGITDKLEAIQSEVVGKTAIIMQQLIQAMNGIGIEFMGIRIDDLPEYQTATEEEKQEIFLMLVETLKARLNNIKNKETEEYLKATLFVSEKLERTIIGDRLVKEAIELKDKIDKDKIDIDKTSIE